MAWSWRHVTYDGENVRHWRMYPNCRPDDNIIDFQGCIVVIVFFPNRFRELSANKNTGYIDESISDAMYESADEQVKVLLKAMRSYYY